MFVVQPHHCDADSNSSGDCSYNILHGLTFPESKNFGGAKRGNIYVVGHATVATLMMNGSVLENKVFRERLNLNH